MKIEFTVDTQQFASLVSEFSKRQASTLAEIGRLKAEKTKQQIESEVDPNGEPFEPLKPATIARKRRLNRILTILRETDRMRESIGATMAGKDTVEISVQDRIAAVYAAKHQTGDPTTNLPQRQFLGWSEEKDLPWIRETVKKKLVE